jgi:hypothetical protein
MLMPEEISILYIVGKGRSGSTILGDVLGSIKGVFHAGELWRLWEQRVTSEHSCSCGETVMNCSVWGRVLERVASTGVGRSAIADPAGVAARQARLFTFGGIARSALRRTLTTERAEARQLAAALYSAIGEITGATLVVDSSKWPLDPALLSPLPGVSTSVVHLVRDPRDVAASWQKLRLFPDTGKEMPTFSPLHSALSWTARNLAAEWLNRHIAEPMIRVRYEDLVAEPRTTVNQVLSTAGFTGSADSIFGDGPWVQLMPGHTIMGNPSRFDHGRIELAPRPGLRVVSRVPDLITYPLRRRYGYED